MSASNQPEGTYQSNGSWQATPGSKHRSLTAQEVDDLKTMAEVSKPIFHDSSVDNSHLPEAARKAHATWEEHHPVAREIFEKRGLKPKA